MAWERLIACTCDEYPKLCFYRLQQSVEPVRGKGLPNEQQIHLAHLQRPDNRHIGMLMRAEPEEILVRRLAQRPLGGSGNNPFLKPNRTAKEYTVLIEPQAIAKKIMQVC